MIVLECRLLLGFGLGTAAVTNDSTARGKSAAGKRLVAEKQRVIIVRKCAIRERSERVRNEISVRSEEGGRDEERGEGSENFLCDPLGPDAGSDLASSARPALISFVRI